MSKIYDALKKAGIEPIPLRINLKPREEDKIIFPILEQVAKEFEQKNKLSGLSIIPYSFPDSHRVERQERMSNGGLILTFNQGIVILTEKIRGLLGFSLDGEMEPTYGGRPHRKWERGYLLAGELKMSWTDNKQIGLSADVVYSQRTEQKPVENPITGAKHFEDVPVGEIYKTIYRWDDSPLWFLTEQDKKEKKR